MSWMLQLSIKFHIYILKTNTVAGGDHLNIANTDIDFFFNL